MRCKNCPAVLNCGFSNSSEDEYCGLGISSEDMNEDLNGEPGCNRKSMTKILRDLNKTNKLEEEAILDYYRISDDFKNGDENINEQK